MSRALFFVLLLACSLPAYAQQGQMSGSATLTGAADVRPLCGTSTTGTLAALAGTSCQMGPFWVMFPPTGDYTCSTTGSGASCLPATQMCLTNDPTNPGGGTLLLKPCSPEAWNLSVSSCPSGCSVTYTANLLITVAAGGSRTIAMHLNGASVNCTDNGVTLCPSTDTISGTQTVSTATSTVTCTSDGTTVCGAAGTGGSGGTTVIAGAATFSGGSMLALTISVTFTVGSGVTCPPAGGSGTCILTAFNGGGHLL